MSPLWCLNCSRGIISKIDLINDNEAIKEVKFVRKKIHLMIGVLRLSTTPKKLHIVLTAPIIPQIMPKMKIEGRNRGCKSKAKWLFPRS
ncbi:hypothetical protein CEXT_564261 [Caerostris extrusa]|uniref:Uncharacterized protein n=1 Tax=Caerostris extrusa TaxID=172846 RepID=A0AAV4WUX2_CAEEX|nr:hypothetical protein CEXT_564261 [Caerostris extrusa]